jgi:HmuY protein
MNTYRIFSILSFSLLLGCSAEEEEFVPNPVFKGGIIEAEVGGPEQPNQVYIDLSKNTSSAVNRQAWDLGFYSGGDFKVILNSSSEMMAYQINKNDLNAVNANDTVGLGAKLSLEAIFGALFAQPSPPWLNQSPSWIDDPARDLSKTAITEINSDDSQNLVFIVNRGKTPDGVQRGWKKIRIIRSGEGYELRYANISDSDFNTAIIQKPTEYYYSFFSFDAGEISVEPKSNLWDLAFTTWTELASFGTFPVPYFFQDFVIINQVGVKVAEVIKDQSPSILEDFNEFSINDSKGLDYSSEVNRIGSSWRTVASPTPGSVTGVKPDRFFVIEDASGNMYKLIFTKMLNDQGERGYPQILFDLL